MPPTTTLKSANILLFIFVILTIFLSTGGYFLYRYQKNIITIEKHTERAAISKLKRIQIANWRTERMSHARSIYYNQAVIKHIHEHNMGIHQKESLQTIETWTKVLLKESEYLKVLLVDPLDKIVITSDSTASLSEIEKSIISRSKNLQDIVLSDLRWAKNQIVYIDLAIPLYTNPEKHEGFSGIVLLRIDPKKSLYPLIRSWPAQSRTGEIYQPIRKQALWIFTFTFLLIFVSGIFIYMLWRQQIVKSERDRKILLQHFDYLVQYANDIIILSDFKGNIYKVNDKAVSTYGYSRDEMLKLNIIQLRPSEIQSAFFHQLKLLSNNEEHLYETYHLRKNGERFPVEVSGRIINIKDKKYFQGIIRDISDRKQALRELHEREQDLLCAQKLAHVGSWSYITETRTSNWSEEMFHVWGLDPKNEVQNYDELRKLIHSDDRQRFVVAVNDALEKGLPYNIELRILSPDGDEHTIISQCNPQIDKQGKVIRLTGTTQDITERKRVEEVIKNMNTELELRVDQRTLQLENANKELEAFSYSVSHDLRAPLRNIDGWSLVLLEKRYDQLDVQGRQYLNRVRNETQRMGYLIDALLKLSRVARVEMKRVEVDLSLIAQNIADRLQEESSNRRLNFEIQSDIVTIGDPQMLEIALTNLLDNACKFTNKQSLAKIEFGQSLINDKQTFWIRDNGVGFDMAYSKNLFNAFQRLHKQSEFPGTGVGLATVQRIIRCHNGQIWAESKLNQGATFYFTLKEETL